MKNVSRFRKLIKKILRTICIWGVLSSILVSANAIDDIETIPLHKYISMEWLSESSPTARVLAYDTIPNSVAGSDVTSRYRGVLVYQSAIDKNTFYHFRYKMKASNTTSINWLNELETGVITQSGGMAYTPLLPANSLAPYMTTIEESYQTQTVKQINMSWDRMHDYSITSYVGAKIYYYFTKTSNNEFVVDAVMYFDDQFFQNGWSFEASSTRYMQCYIGIFLPMTGVIRIEDVDVYPVGGSDYNGKLDQIISLLQAQGAGLSKEDIQEATERALENHAQQEQQQAQQSTQDAQQQAEQAIARYTEVMDQMRLAMAGIEDITDIDTSTYTLTIGPFTNPMTGGTFPAVGIDFYSAYMQLPLLLRTTCPIVVTFFVLMAYAREFLDIFRHVEKTMHGEDGE